MITKEEFKNKYFKGRDIYKGKNTWICLSYYCNCWGDEEYEEFDGDDVCLELKKVLKDFNADDYYDCIYYNETIINFGTYKGDIDYYGSCDIYKYHKIYVDNLYKYLVEHGVIK